MSPFDHQHAIPSSEPLGQEDLETVRAITTPDTAHAINMAMHLFHTGGDAGKAQAMLILISKLGLMDLRHQDGEAVISVLTTHATNYAEAVAEGLIVIEEEGEKQALARVIEFVLEKRPVTTLADLVFRVKRLAVADTAAILSVDN